MNWKISIKKLIKRFMFLGGAFFIVSNCWVAFSNNSKLFSDIEQVPKKEYGLLLGTKKDGKNGTNLYFQYRMDAMAELYFNGKVDTIIVSGDNHINSYDETSDMFEYLVKIGVPAGIIKKDYAGFRTLDSVVRAKKVFHVNSLIIVSQEFHNKRALFIADYYGLNAVAYNARDPKRRLGSLHWREFFARPLMILDLYLFHTQPKFLSIN